LSVQHKRVFWFAGLAPKMSWWECDMLMMLCRHTKHEYVQWRLQYPIRVNKLRHLMIEKFMLETSDPLDTLVFMDIDHQHEPHTINALVAPDILPVHTVLSFKRDPTIPVPLAMDYNKGWDNQPATHVTGFKPGDILEVDRGAAVGMAVQRRVFVNILEAGYGFKDFFVYKGERDCDEWFARLCSEVGSKHYVNTGIISPHMTGLPSNIDLADWDAYMKRTNREGIRNAE